MIIVSSRVRYIIKLELDYVALAKPWNFQAQWGTKM